MAPFGPSRGLSDCKGRIFFFQKKNSFFFLPAGKRKAGDFSPASSAIDKLINDCNYMCYFHCLPVRSGFPSPAPSGQPIFLPGYTYIIIIELVNVQQEIDAFINPLGRVNESAMVADFPANNCLYLCFHNFLFLSFPGMRRAAVILFC